MIWLALVLVIGGLFLSAFFSGTETGFYRASRVRLVMDGMQGDRLSSFLLKMINNPSLFVATTLVGNNLANYLTSLGLVLAARYFYGNDAQLAEMIAPIVLSPALFVYGESLPKSLYYAAPNKLLRLGAPLFFVFTVLLAPVAALLWGLGRLLERFLGRAPEKVQLALARKELQEVLQEGIDVGILQTSQRQLAQNFFLVATSPAVKHAQPISKVHSVSQSASVEETLRLARKQKLQTVPVYGESKNDLIGYVQTIDLQLVADKTKPITNFQPMLEVRENEQYGETIIRMQSERKLLGRLIDANGQTIGITSFKTLTDELFDKMID
ncbi:CNNM domain-containing protein [Vicingaceae bacterium]|nr:CNNM domain-containing protein [Vicingaceae bacterium]